MIDYQTYPTRKAAVERKNAMIGWPKARLFKINDYATEADAQAGVLTPMWAIECAPGLVLRKDGYVR